MYLKTSKLLWPAAKSTSLWLLGLLHLSWTVPSDNVIWRYTKRDVVLISYQFVSPSVTIFNILTENKRRCPGSRSSHLSVPGDNWYTPPVLSPKFEHSCFGGDKDKADNHRACQSKRCHSNRPGSVRSSSQRWSLSTNTHLKQRWEREREREQQ